MFPGANYSALFKEQHNDSQNLIIDLNALDACTCTDIEDCQACSFVKWYAHTNGVSKVFLEECMYPLIKFDLVGRLFRN